MRRTVIQRFLRGTVVVAVVAAVAPGIAQAEPVPVPTVPGISLDVAALGRPAALKYCATKAFAADPDSVRVLYGGRQLRGATAASRTFVLRNGAGKVLLCDLFGRDRPSVLPLPATSASKPAVVFSNGQRRWSCDGTAMKSFTMTNWLKVQDPIRSARLRYSVDGVPGPWFTAARHGRFIHLQSWLGPTAADDVLKVELQLRDQAGDPVTVPGIASGARKLDGCAGNVVIG